MWARLVKTLDSTSTSKSHFGWETTHCGPMALKFDDIFQAPFGAISCHGGLRMDPIVTLQDINAVDRPCKTMAKIPKISKDYHSWTWWGRLSPDITDQKRQQFVERSRRSPINFLWEDPARCLTRIWVLTCLALGEPSLQLATSHPQTNPPSMNKWISDFLHCGTRHRRHDVPIKNCALMGCLRGRVLRDFRCRSCFCLNS